MTENPPAVNPVKKGLSDKTQAILTVISASLIACAAATIPIGVPWYGALALALTGAIGLGIKEALGSAW